MNLINVKFKPANRTVTAKPGQTIAQAARDGGIALPMPCGGTGTCGKCRVKLTAEDSIVKACQYHLASQDIEVEILAHDVSKGKILADMQPAGGELLPLVRKYALRLPEPSIDDLHCDVRRLEKAAGRIAGKQLRADTAILRSLPVVCRQADWQITAVVCDDRIIAVEPGDTTESLYGVAVDVGTTTLALALMDLNQGKVIATEARSNPQRAFGDDVISRIEFTRANEDGLALLHQTIIDAVNQMISRVCDQGGMGRDSIYAITVAGNATMQHLFWRVPVWQIGHAPYVAGFTCAVLDSARMLGLDIHPDGRVYLMPGVAGHVGGDTVAVALAADLKKLGLLTLAIDIGTNGEMVLAGRGRMLTCSTAAGPAFEGARIRCGMRGADGAIEKVRLTGQVELTVIGSGRPAGLCGSGLIDAVAELLRLGMIDATGRYVSGAELPDQVPGAISGRLIEFEGAGAFVLASAQETENGQPVILTQRDIRETQLAKGAIRAGVEVLLRRLDAGVEDIDRVYLAGAFGNYIDACSARAIGLLPAVKLEHITPIGNGAGRGAAMALISGQWRQRAQELAGQMEYVELAGDAGFQTIFMDNMELGEK